TGQVLYEVHIGTFTREGTLSAAIAQLPDLVDLGVTVIEIMPIAEFAGRFGWGYDGVDLYAPSHLYGRPDDFRSFVDHAHTLGLGVILDVVYNHLGPEANYLGEFSRDYFATRYQNEWGEAINFDGRNAREVRDFFASNAAYWIDEYHLDGLRLDATQQIFDASQPHILAEVRERAQAVRPDRTTFIIAENERQDTALLRKFGLDALWNDDFHHSALVALTGHREAYYSDYRGQPQEFVSALKHNFLFQGQRYAWQDSRRGTDARDISRERFIIYLENHDQVANQLHGARLHELTSPAKLRAATALLLLAPQTPALFQGQEFAASSPFLYFADLAPELAAAVATGRAAFMSQFPSVATQPEQLPVPGDTRTFERCKLNHDERRQNQPVVDLHRDLITLRTTDAVIARAHATAIDGAVIAPAAFVIRYVAEAGERLMVVNLGIDLHLPSIAEPLVAPPTDMRWSLLWSSEAPKYGGSGAIEPDAEDGWHVRGESTLVLEAVAR
ncbi:MAG: alpha-amylase family glycosyl hydrolase, partial [Gemmatimonadota bacterium]